MEGIQGDASRCFCSLPDQGDGLCFSAASAFAPFLGGSPAVLGQFAIAFVSVGAVPLCGKISDRVSSDAVTPLDIDTRGTGVEHRLEMAAESSSWPCCSVLGLS